MSCSRNMSLWVLSGIYTVSPTIVWAVCILPASTVEMTTSNASSSRMEGQGDLEEMMRDLSLNEEDLDDVIFEYDPRWRIIVGF